MTTYILKTLVSFTGNQTGSDGGYPAYTSLIADSAGNLYGTTQEGGASGYGTVFEIKNTGSAASPSYVTSPTTLVSFTGYQAGTNGGYPEGSLIADSAGNLYGTTEEGGASGYGTVFEIKNTGSAAIPSYATSLTTLVSFDYTNGGLPLGSLIADSAGNLYGTTYEGGASGYGTVFEIKNTGSATSPSYATSPTTLVSFAGNQAGTNGGIPLGSLIADSAGNLYGTTQEGGASGYGTVFEIKNTGSATSPSYATSPTTLVSFAGNQAGTNGGIPLGSLIADSAGNLYGTTQEGGASGYGTVFEIKNTGSAASPSYVTSPTTLVSFTGYQAGTNGGYPEGSLIADSAGNLYGTTEAGGASGYGTVFEIKNTGSAASPSYATSPTTLVSFTGYQAGTNGGYPLGSLIADSAGNLYGTTYEGGASGVGTVFELVIATPSVTAETAAVTAGAVGTSSGGTGGTGALAGDSDPQGGTLFITAVSAGSGVSQTIAAGSTSANSPTVVTGSYGTLQLGADGSYNYAASNGLAIVTAADGSPITDTFNDTVTASEGGSSSSSLAVTVSLAAGGTETVNDPTGTTTYSIGATTLTLTDDTAATYGGVIQDGSSGNTGGKVVVNATGGPLTLSGVSTYTGGTTIIGGTLELASANAAGTGGIAFSGSTATLQLDSAALASGGTDAKAISGFTMGDTLDLRGLAYQTDDVAVLSGGTLSVGDTTASDTLTSFADASGQTGYFAVSSDGHGGTNVVLTQPVAPTVSGTHANATTSETAVTPFSGVTIGDTNGGATDTLTIAVGGTGGTLTGAGTLVNGIYTLTGTAAAITTKLDAVSFAPTAGQPNTAPTSTFSLSDKSSAFATAATDGTTTVVDTDPAVAPTIAGVDIAIQSTASEAAVTPFSTVTVSDTNNAGANGNTLTITQTGAGTLSGTGLVAGASSTYTLTGTAAAITSNLDALVFTPADGVPNTSVSTIFTLQDADATAGTSSATSAAVTVADTDPAVTPTITRAAASYSLTTLATFTGANGANPSAGLVADSAGNLYGTTNDGGTSGDGTVFEIVKTTGTLQTLAIFTGANGAIPYAGLVTDSAGNLYGTTIVGGASNDGTVFEIVKSSGALQTLATFTGANGANPYAGLVTDSAGNLYGTTNDGGTSGDGTVFELVQSTGALQTLATFTGTANGEFPSASLYADSAGNLYGTTYSGGASNDGTVFEIVKSTGALQTLATFTGTPNGEFPSASLYADSVGNLYGTTYSGGASNDGTVFEIVKSTGALQTLVTFTGTANGAGPNAGVVADRVGNLYGTTLSGGASSLGTVFEIVKSSGALQTLATFTGTANGVSPSGLYADSAGNLYGTTAQGGASGAGTVFELTPYVAPVTTTSEVPVTPFARVTIGDANDATDTLTITVGGTGGTLTGTGFTGGAGGVYTLTGTAAAITQNLDALSFTPTAGQPNTTSTSTFALSDTSTAFATPATDSMTTVVDTDPAVAPVIAGTVGAQITVEDAPVTPFSGVTITDPNVGTTEIVSISLVGAGGVLTDGTGFSQLASGGTAGTYSLSGTAAAVTAELDALVFQPTGGAASANVSTSFTLFALVDLTTASTYATDYTASVVDVDLPAPAPVITGTHASTTTSEATVTPFSGVTIADGNTGAADTLTITVGGSGGTLTDATGFSGLTAGATAGVYVLTGTAAAVTSELDALVFTQTAGTPDTHSTATFSLSDLSSVGTVTSDTATTVFDTDPAVAPVIAGTVAAQVTVSDAPVTPFAGVTITDPNAGTTETLSISVIGAGGVLTDGTGFSNLTSSSTAGTYALSGTAADVTAELDALVFHPTGGAASANVTTSFTLFALVDLTTASTYATDYTASVVDVDLPATVAPVITGTHANTTTSEAPVTPFSGVTIADGTSGATETLMITIGGSGGTLTDASGFNGLTAGATAGVYVLSGTAAAVTSELDALVFTPAAGTPDTHSTATFTLSDLSSVGTGTSDAATTVIDTDPAVAPVIAGTIGAQITVSDASVTPFSGVTITDPNVGTTETLSISVIGTGGVLTDGTGFSQLTSGGTAGTYALSGTAAAVTSELDALVFQPTGGAASPNVTTSFTLFGLVDVTSAFTYATDYTASVVDVDLPATEIDGPIAGNATIQGTPNADIINAYGSFNTIYDNGGNDVVNAGLGNATVNNSTGNVVTNLQGSFNTVIGGDGNDTVSGSAGNSSVTLGNGNNSVTAGGLSNTIEVGSGTNIILAGSGLDSVTAAAGTDTITLAGNNNSVTLNGSNATVKGGQGDDSVTANGGVDQLTFAGSNSQATLNGVMTASIMDLGNALRINIGSNTQTDTISGFGTSDTFGVVDFKNGAGGFTSVAAIVNALHSDGYGGTMLALGTTGSIDFAGTTPSQLHASNFAVG